MPFFSAQLGWGYRPLSPHPGFPVEHSCGGAGLQPFRVLTRDGVQGDGAGV